MLRIIRAFAVAMLAVLVVACGGGGGGGGGQSASEEQATLRERLSSLVECARRDDLKAATPWLALQEYEIATASGKPRNVKDLTPAEQADVAAACFTQIKGFVRVSALKDVVAVKAAITAGSIKVMPKMRLAELYLTTPRADGRGKDLRFRAKFARQSDGEWRLSEMQEQFN